MSYESFTEICDFGRSFIRWGIDTLIKAPITVSHKPPHTLNKVRVPAECLAEVRDRKTRRPVSFLLGAACKSERVGVERDIWIDPNADFFPVTSEDSILVIKKWDRCDKGVMRYPQALGVQPERQLEKASDAYSSFEIEIHKCQGAPVEEIDDMIEILEAGKPMVSRTLISAEHYDLLLEYPVKTVNWSPREKYYQVDTGPVLFPDLTLPTAEVHASFQLAYIAHTKKDWAEFLVRVPTPLTEDIKVYHYSKAVRIDCENSMIAVVH